MGSRKDPKIVRGMAWLAGFVASIMITVSCAWASARQEAREKMQAAMRIRSLGKSGRIIHAQMGREPSLSTESAGPRWSWSTKLSVRKVL
jgi:hypothetical protein